MLQLLFRHHAQRVRMIQRLKKRADFLACASSGHKWVRPAFVLQVNPRPASNMAEPRLGFTTSSKLGNAVCRNRIRRRLREAARLALTDLARPQHDYVLIGRPAAADIEFTVLQSEMAEGLLKLHHIMAKRG